MGRCKFPVTTKTPEGSQYAGTIEIITGGAPIRGIKYQPLGAVGIDSFDFQVDERLTTDKNTILSVLSAIQAFVIDDDTQQRNKTIYVSVLSSAQDLRISGASEGLAAAIAIMGIEVPNDFCVTGYVAAFGQKEAETDNLRVLNVDCVPIKIQGATENGMNIMVPGKKFQETVVNGKKVVTVSKLGEALDYFE